MKFVLISPKNRTVYNFRGDLIKKIVAKGYDVLVTGPDESDIEKIRALGADFIVIPMNKTGTSVVGDLKYCLGLYKLFRAEKPDVTLGYTVKPVIYGALAAKLAGVKNINSMVTGGGYVFSAKTFKAKALGVIVKMLYKLGFACAKTVVFQNVDDLEEFVKKRLLNKKKCSVVNGSGVNMEHFTPAPYPENFAFFMLSRLLKSKGVVEYLRAAKVVKEKHPEAKFYLLGKYEAQMQDAIPKEVIEQYISDGTVERFEETDDVRPYYEKCSVYVLPSYREGTPRTVLEAMAMGRPIITTDTNGCRDTVVDGQNGFLVPVGDFALLANKMCEFIENTDLVDKMGKASVKYCTEKYEVGRVNNIMCEYLKI